MGTEIYKLQQQLVNVMTAKRFYHSLGVQGMSLALAIHYGYDQDKANLAGLLHDCAKDLKDADMLSECEKNQIPVKDIEKRNPYLLHGKLGAFYAQFKYGVTDEEIISSITHHTAGKPEMTMLEKIIFVADYIEPNRSAQRIPELQVIRTMAFRDLDAAVLKILGNTIQYLRDKNQEIEHLSIEAYNYYKNAESNSDA
jgi:predicted HD superfamily hydrolase involved in NAD metabolism